jgi:hypothetical protein
MNQYGHVRLDARSSLQFCAFANIDFLDEFDRHIGFARQTFYLRIRIGGTIDRSLARSIFHDLILPRSLSRGSFAYQTCHFGPKVGQGAMHPARSVICLDLESFNSGDPGFDFYYGRSPRCQTARSRWDIEKRIFAGASRGAQ